MVIYVQSGYKIFSGSRIYHIIAYLLIQLHKVFFSPVCNIVELVLHRVDHNRYHMLHDILVIKKARQADQLKESKIINILESVFLR